MQKTENPIAPFTARSWDGQQFGPYWSLTELADVHRFGRVGLKLHTYWPPQFTRQGMIWEKRVVAEIMVIDALGSVVDPQLIYEHRAKLHKFRFRRSVSFKWRNGVVPGTGKHVWGGWLRRPKTMQERRASFVVTDDGEVPCRAQRNARNLPTAWDDIPRDRERGWKAHRRFQARNRR